MPATFHFYLREDRPDKKGKCPIYLRITCNRKMKYHNTGIRIEPSDWRDDKEEVRRSHSAYNKLNEELDILLEKVQQAARILRRENKESAAAIKERLIGATNDNFFSLAEDHLKELERNNQFYLRKQTKATLTKLEEFNGSKNLLFTEINSRFLERFQDWMKTKKGNKGSTIRKNMGDMRRIIKLARKKHLIFNDPFEDVDPVPLQKSTYKPKLTFQEIQKIESLELPVDTVIWHSRNAFVLSFYFCGMRFGDVASLRWENVSGGTLEYQMSKTGNSINIEIQDGAKRILSFYDTPDKAPEDFVLPFCNGLNGEDRRDPNEIRRTISSWNANVNDSLKDIAKKADIDKKLSMHVARHSFAQYMADKDVSKYKMMILLGHKSIKTTENYLDTINVKVGNETLRNLF